MPNDSGVASAAEPRRRGRPPGSRDKAKRSRRSKAQMQRARMQQQRLRSQSHPPPRSRARASLPPVQSVPSEEFRDAEPDPADDPDDPEPSNALKNFFSKVKSEIRDTHSDCHRRLKAGHLWYDKPNEFVTLLRTLASGFTRATPASFVQPRVFLWYVICPQSLFQTE